MRRVLLLAANDLRLTLTDRAAAIWLVLLPLGLMWFFGQMGRGGQGVPKISLAVEDRDGGWLARALVGELADEQVELREATPQPAAGNAPGAGEAQAAGGAVDSSAQRAEPPADPPTRTLVIPQGFTEKVLAGEQQVLTLRQRPGGARDFGAAAQVHVVRAIGRTLARLVEMRLEAKREAPPEREGQSGERVGVTAVGAPPAAVPQAEERAAGATIEATDLLGGHSAADAAARFRALGEREPLVRLAVSTAGRGRPVPGGFAQSVPGSLTMTVLMMTLIYGAIFLTLEKREGMLRRQAGLPLSRGQIFAGKLLGRCAVAAVQIAVLVAAGRLLFGVTFGDSPAGLALVLAAYAFAVGSLATLLGAVVATPEQAEGVATVASLVMASLGGCWWPSEVMPSWLQTAAHVLPTAWAMDAFHGLISWGRGLEGVALPVAVLVGFGLLFSFLGARWLRFA